MTKLVAGRELRRSKLDQCVGVDLLHNATHNCIINYGATIPVRGKAAMDNGFR